MSRHDRATQAPPRDDVEIIECGVVYDGYVRVQKLALRHALHAGGWCRVIARELVERGDAVAVLPYDPVLDAVALVRQFRIGAWGNGCDPWLVEAVAGIVEPGESPEDVARREAVEEAGCTLGRLFRVCAYYASPGVLTETIAVYVGVADLSSAGGNYGLDHEGEDIEAFVLPWNEAWAQMQEGKFHDHKIAVTLQWLALNRDWLRRDHGSRGYNR